MDLYLLIYLFFDVTKIAGHIRFGVKGNPLKVVSVLSSHYPGSFTQALNDSFGAGLAEAGHEFTTIDLYGEKFDPVMNGDDFNQFTGGDLPADVLKHQEILKDAGALAFFYPVWWNDMPGIMKGWIDRIMAKGFAYDIIDGGKVGTFPCKKILLFCTLGNAAEDQHPGLEEAMRVKEEHGVFAYTGCSEITHHFLYNVNDKSVRPKYLELAKSVAAGL